jgi:hypothetical protein
MLGLLKSYLGNSANFPSNKPPSSPEKYNYIPPKPLPLEYSILDSAIVEKYTSNTNICHFQSSLTKQIEKIVNEHANSPRVKSGLDSDLMHAFSGLSGTQKSGYGSLWIEIIAEPILAYFLKEKSESSDELTKDLPEFNTLNLIKIFKKHPEIINSIKKVMVTVYLKIQSDFNNKIIVKTAEMKAYEAKIMIMKTASKHEIEDINKIINNAKTEINKLSAQFIYAQNGLYHLIASIDTLIAGQFTTDTKILFNDMDLERKKLNWTCENGHFATLNLMYLSDEKSIHFNLFKENLS